MLLQSRAFSIVTYQSPVLNNLSILMIHDSGVVWRQKSGLRILHGRKTHSTNFVDLFLEIYLCYESIAKARTTDKWRLETQDPNGTKNHSFCQKNSFKSYFEGATNNTSAMSMRLDSPQGPSGPEKFENAKLPPLQEVVEYLFSPPAGAS